MASAVTAYTYTVKKDDTLKSIAKEYFGDEAAAPALEKYNNTPADDKPPEGAQISLPTILVWPKEQTDENGVSVLVNKVFKRIKGYSAVFYEVEDVHFHHNSAVPCLSPKGALLNTIADALGYIEAHPEAEIAIAGHASTPGDPENNIKLSQDRAKAIRALLDDDEKTFTDIANARSTSEDIYSILESLTDFYKWNCDPGGKANAANSASLKPAILAFQKEYNQKLDGSIDEDGAISKKIWGAVYKTYQYYISEFCKSDNINLSVARLMINYEKKTNGIIGCGEDTPMDSAGKEKYKSSTNRRTEIVFLDPASKPQEKEILIKQATDIKPGEKKDRKIESEETDFIVPWFIDCHMHCNSAKCAPSPLVTAQVWERVRTVNFRSAGIIQYSGKTTEEIGIQAIKESAKVLNDKSLKKMGDISKRKRIIVNMPMDLDFAHYEGFNKKKIYEMDKNGFWEILANGSKSQINDKKYQAWEKYEKQLEAIQNIWLKGKGQVLSFFHYDPRRWSHENIDIYKFTGKWDDPFCLINNHPKNKQPSLVFSKNNIDFPVIGYKMYSSLGYKPDDFKRLPKLHHFYAECSNPAYDIPITCHGSRGGMRANGWGSFFEHDNVKELYEANKRTSGQEAAYYKNKKEYFDFYYISPFAWEQVLRIYPKLRICLAHFGGEESWGPFRGAQKYDWYNKLIELMSSYENFYVDLSYFHVFDPLLIQLTDAIQNKKVRRKLLFGTDWYMISQEKVFNTYQHYFKELYNKFTNMKILNIDKQILSRILIYNPLRFLKLRQQLPSLGKYNPATIEWIRNVPEEPEL
jgi:outer membrane protein OmpA-like peptidoglycan-associated protein/predicted TIM-barrel fold metal-dependent hydrolase